MAGTCPAAAGQLPGSCRAWAAGPGPRAAPTGVGIDLIARAYVRLKDSSALADMEALIREAEKAGRLRRDTRGRIKMYNPAKGWGFVRCNDSERDIF